MTTGRPKARRSCVTPMLPGAEPSASDLAENDPSRGTAPPVWERLKGGFDPGTAEGEDSCRGTASASRVGGQARQQVLRPCDTHAAHAARGRHHRVVGFDSKGLGVYSRRYADTRQAAYGNCQEPRGARVPHRQIPF